jgi:hypothetical protein
MISDGAFRFPATIARHHHLPSSRREVMPGLAAEELLSRCDRACNSATDNQRSGGVAPVQEHRISTCYQQSSSNDNHCLRQGISEAQNGNNGCRADGCGYQYEEGNAPIPELAP